LSEKAKDGSVSSDEKDDCTKIMMQYIIRGKRYIKVCFTCFANLVSFILFYDFYFNKVFS